MKILYFSATGNNLYVAKALGGTILSIPKLIKQNDFDFIDDKIGIVFPVYGLEVPRYIEEFFDRVAIKSPYVFVIMTYGMYAGSAISHMKRIADRNNIKISYLNKVIMVDNYLPVYKMEEQIASESSKQIEEQISKIKEDLDSNRLYSPKDSFVSKALTWIARKIRFPQRNKELGVHKKTFDRVFSVEKSCTSCGICGKVCPVDNIIINREPEFKGSCIGCLSCTHNCPQNAIRVNGERSTVRYRNSHITLRELIDSNS